MIQILDKSQCCGCTACVSICPKQCITMREDEEGFLYPVVDSSHCIDCNLCKKVCPELYPKEMREPLHVYAAKQQFCAFIDAKLLSARIIYLAVFVQVLV